MGKQMRCRTAEEKAPKIGRAPLDGYEKIARQEEAELKRLSVKEAIRRLEILLRAAGQWKK
ncbi:MAG: hypothetical protein HY673_19765 [Chloroflexi bacterium]|nr:hypothetical protein [Chloroflexota bacterium]